MYIEKIEIENFKCFGQKQIFNMKKGVNALVGDNGSGKTTVLEALDKILRGSAISKDDFHESKKGGHKINPNQMIIDLTICLDDLESPPYVRDYFFKQDNEKKVRIRLEAESTGNQDQDDVEYRTYVIHTINEIQFGADAISSSKKPISKRDLRFLEYIYIPANRNGKSATTQELKKLLKRIENDIDWNAEFQKQLTDSSETLQGQFETFAPIKYIRDSLVKNYSDLYDLSHGNNPTLAISQIEFHEIIRSINLFFDSPFTLRRLSLEDLSEGQVSLLYLALSITYHNLIYKLNEDITFEGSELFKNKNYHYPALLLFGVEEPENHLSPFYLSKIMQKFDGLKNEMRSQTFVTSHSTSILRHIPYNQITFLRRDFDNGNCFSREINLNDIPDDESKKFIKQAVENNPEIYFARLMIIGEGDSEKIVIPKIAKAYGLDLDTNFIAFVPIGGRHAKHLWRLADMLNIPHITLLDYDLGRKNGGEKRLAEAEGWLDSIGITKVPDQSTGDEIWRKYEKEHSIYYSHPIDLDMMLIQSFPTAYSGESNVSNRSLLRSVYKESATNSFEKDIPLDDDRLNDLPIKDEVLLKSYKALFDSKSKVVSHETALGKLEYQEIKDGCPRILESLIKDAQQKLLPKKESIEDGISE